MTNIQTIIHLLRDSDRPAECVKLMDDAADMLRLYHNRLNPLPDLETGATEDEIDRLQFEVEMLKVDKEKLKKQFWHTFSEQPATRGNYLCRMTDGDKIIYADLKFDDGWFGQGYRAITHWAEIPMLLWKE